MKVIYIYNMESEIERNHLSRIREELGENIILEYDYQIVKDVIPVRATPAFIIIRDDLQGDDLLEGDVQLKITAEVYKAMTEEDEKIHNLKSSRLDVMVNGEKTKAIEALITEISSDIEANPVVKSALPKSIKDKLGID